MADDNKPALTPPVSLKINQMMIQGRIQHVSRFDGNVDHIVVTPAC